MNRWFRHPGSGRGQPEANMTQANAPTTTPDPPQRELRISIDWLIGSLILLSLSSLGALVIVATVTKADTLSTVALALAVLAFLAQLVLSIAQNIAANRQFADIVAVNTQAQAALSEIRQATGEALARRDQQFERLLQTIVPTALADSLSDAPTLAREVDVDALADRIVEHSLARFDQLSRDDRAHSNRPPTGRGRLETLINQFPDVADSLRTLPPSMQIEFWREAMDNMDRLVNMSRDEQRSEFERMMRARSSTGRGSVPAQ
jgi:hypothetical protein